MGRNHIADALLATIIIAVVLFLFIGAQGPGLFVHREPARKSTCMSNLNQIGKGLKSYLTDWEDHFSTNRCIVTGKVSRSVGDMNAHVDLSVPDEINPKVFQYGINWVEALYPYIERAGAPGDSQTIWVCPNSSSAQWKGANSATAACSYAFNFNLLEFRGEDISNPDRMMMLREMDGLYGAVCRPSNRSTNASERPIDAFLTGRSGSDPLLHQQRGSCILFVDGHVKLLTSDQMPTDDKLVFDKATQQWWNSAEPGKRKIAVNP